MDYGILSLAPVLIALVLSFVTKDALLSILVGVIVGVIITGTDPITGLSGIFQSALGTPDFIWVLYIEIFIGIMVAYFQKSGAIQAFANWIGKFNLSRRMTSGAAWCLGLLIFFSDYFSAFSSASFLSLSSFDSLSMNMVHLMTCFGSG